MWLLPGSAGFCLALVCGGLPPVVYFSFFHYEGVRRAQIHGSNGQR